MTAAYRGSDQCRGAGPARASGIAPWPDRGTARARRSNAQQCGPMVVFVAPSTALPPVPAQPDGLAFPTNGWPTGPAPDGLTPLIDEVFADRTAPDVEERHGRSLAFVAIHEGRLVAEAYGPTAGPDEQLISWSMAKSITQALVGILVGDGRLDLHAPVLLDGWEGADDPRSAITMDHLLRMVPGTEFNEDYVDAGTSHCIEMLFGSGNPDMAAYTAALPSIAPPDTVFNYSSGTTVLVCKLLADLVGTGQAFETWMRDVLLDPLGIEARLTFDDAGTWVGSSFLHATARDFAKFGLLYARRWGVGRQAPAAGGLGRLRPYSSGR